MYFMLGNARFKHFNSLEATYCSVAFSSYSIDDRFNRNLIHDVVIDYQQLSELFLARKGL